MRKLSVFDSVSLDGFFTDAADDMSWAHRQDEEWNAFTAGNAGRRGRAAVRPGHLRDDAGLLDHAAGGAR